MSNHVRQWWVVPGPNGGEPEIRNVPRPEPGEGQVLVEVAGAAINRGELIGRPAMRTDNPNAKAAPSGIEFAGVIDRIGAGVAGWTIGDHVMGRGSACHADAVVVDAAALMPVPAKLTLQEAAAIPNVFVTAHDAIVSAARITEGESVLITAGSSGVGTAAIQIAKTLGSGNIVATSRSGAKTDALLELGATHVVETNSDEWAAQLLDQAGPMDVVIDQVGGDLFPSCLKTMTIAARYVTVGRNGGKHASIDLDLVARQRLELIGVTFRTRTAAESRACSDRFVADLLPLFDSGSLRPVLDKTFPLADLQAAHQYMLSDAQIGKIVLVP